MINLLEGIIKDYSNNKFKKLNMLLGKNSAKGKAMVLMIAIDTKDTINFIFKQVLDILKSARGNEFKVNATGLSQELAERYIRLVKFFFYKDNIKVKKILDNKEWFDSLDTKFYIILGGTLLENILSNDKLFEKIYEFKGTDLNIFIKTKESYINKFIISSINMKLQVWSFWIN